MKIQCSYCSKEEASVFCTADEAALCDICDRQVHHANKLSGKHKRFFLLHHHHFPASCDICQDNRAIIFCTEDRAILCKECDVCIHKVNEHTRKHNRFLLSGVKLSASASEYPSSLSSPFSTATAPDQSHSSSKPSPEIKRPTTTSLSQLSPAEAKPSTRVKPTSVSPTEKTPPANQSISQYLMETLPGWRVDDFLDPSSYAFTQFPDHGVGTQLSSFPYEDLAGWVPQDTPHFNHLPLYISHTGVGNGLKVASQESKAVKISRQRVDDGFTVPEMISSTPPLKKSRNLW